MSGTSLHVVQRTPSFHRLCRLPPVTGRRHAGRCDKTHDQSQVSPAVKRIVGLVQQFVRSSRFPVYRRETHKGVWRTLLVRHSDRTKQLMIVLEAQPPTPELLAAAAAAAATASTTPAAAAAAAAAEHTAVDPAAGTSPASSVALFSTSTTAS